MKTAQQVIMDIVRAEPRFMDHFRKDVDLWLDDSGDMLLCGIFSSLTKFVADDIGKDHAYNYRNLFELVESYIAGEDKKVADAAATCFIENLQNMSNDIDPILWISYTGEATKDFARAWDKFTGAKTQGL